MLPLSDDASEGPFSTLTINRRSVFAEYGGKVDYSYVLRQTNNGVDGAIVVKVVTGAVITRADGADALGCAVGVTVQESPSCGRGNVGNGSLRAIL